jgi:polyphosphate kinase 2
MQDMINNSASAARNPEGHDNGVMVFSWETPLCGHDNSATVPASDPTKVITQAELARLKSPKQLLELLQAKAFDVGKIKSRLDYERELRKLQIELVKMQRWVQEKHKRVAIIVEGRDAAGKGGTIRRFTQYLNPRAMRVVALPVPTEEERGQWYFQRYIRQLPNRGEVVFFDAVVEPVNGFCTREQYERFMRQAPEFEHMLFEDGITLIKFWFSISKEEQVRRFKTRAKNPLKHWKLSPIDGKAQQLWDAYTKYKEIMFRRTHTAFSPWVIVQANNKRKARLESMRYVLSSLDYEGRDTAEISLYPDPNIITRYQRSASNLD